MADSILMILQPILNYLSVQYGQVGLVFGYIVLVVAPIMTVAIDVADVIIKQVASKKVQEEADAINDFWDRKILPWLEVIPHANIPVGSWTVSLVKYLKKGAAAVVAGIKGWNSTE